MTCWPTGRVWGGNYETSDRSTLLPVSLGSVTHLENSSGVQARCLQCGSGYKYSLFKLFHCELMNIDFQFRSPEQEAFFWSKVRNNCYSGGFGNGKSYAGCLRQFIMLSTFPGYRSLIARFKFKDLTQTTMKTFFKICPKELIESHYEKDGITYLKNGSQVLWYHLDDFNERSFKSLEINSAFVDQAEEVPEGVYLVLDSRIGRWDGYSVPEELLNANPDWPLTKFGRPRVYNFLDIGCNPDTTLHWIYNRYHPESFVKRDYHFFVEAATNPDLNDPGTIREMQSRDPEWVAKYFYGKWGASQAQIHHVNSMSFLDYDAKFFEEMLQGGALYRILDHGDAAPTCCLWVAAYKKVHIFFREYYAADSLISTHRRNITDLSIKESYVGDYADPKIFAKAAQKDGGFWTVADEYLSTDIEGEPISWSKADNNEFATRNRINELLKLSVRFKHPITGEIPAPGIYFIKRSAAYPYGCFHAISQIQAQRREYLGTENGKSIYTDERDDGVTDHAYDPIRYYVSMHGTGLSERKLRPPRNSFAYFNKFLPKRAPRQISLYGPQVGA